MLVTMNWKRTGLPIEVAGPGGVSASCHVAPESTETSFSTSIAGLVKAL